MRKLILLLSLLFIPSLVNAQSLTNDTCVTFTDTGCASFRVAGQGSIGIQITGTWSGTITFQGSIDNTNFVTLQVIPSTSATPVTTTTGNGVWTASIAGLTSVRARMTSFSDGTAVVTFRVAQSAKSRGGSSGGGGGSGDALVSDPLSQFASTTSAQLAGVISNETGSGVLVYNNSPTFITPTLGAATATTLDTGQGANELFGMDQNVTTTSDVTFDALTVTSCTGCGTDTGITQLTGDVTAGPGNGSQAATIPDTTITLAKMANLAEDRIIGRAVGAGTGVPTALTGEQVRSIIGPGQTVQVVTNSVTASATGTGTIPIDNTIPQNTEGTEFMTLAITPTSASNKLIIEVLIFVVNGTINQWMMVALFQDSGADSINSQLMWQPAVNQGTPIALKHIMTAGTTSATTFKVRAGANLAGTTYFNRLSSGDFLGGVITSSITITEIVN